MLFLVYNIYIFLCPSQMVVNFTAKIMIGYDPEKSRALLGKAYKSVAESLMSLPLNIPGTAYNKGL